MAETRKVLLADPELGPWVRALEDAHAPGVGVAVPGGVELADVLLDLGVAPEDVNPVLAARAELGADDALSALLDRCVALAVRDIGLPHGGPGGGPALGPDLPELPTELGAAARWFTLFTLIGTLPYTRAYHRDHGVPDETTRRTLADVGRHVTLHRRQFGTPGVLHPRWLLRAFRGTLYQLGRLQFERARLGGTMGRTLASAGLLPGPGAAVLLVHIPDFRGPLTPEACDASLAAARAFFPRHFPAERYPVAVCYSWLLDPQLAEHLPATSNIVRFQRRFHPGQPDPTPDDRTPVGFVFGDPELPPAGLPRRTTLERAIGDHLRAGGHWHSASGWLAL
ncbi:acyltransferase domain-containing protein [Streptomyces sp. NBC_01190]|uniref:acyltransferase domain-containing protein n=1 Tax=Streptomyces sp. NBC_01190 TaxID=2903767 RepID=UPI00386807A3|nr:acyltransferase domain-containing protein [Streptomyces sp. NBC_01190]